MKAPSDGDVATLEGNNCCKDKTSSRHLIGFPDGSRHAVKLEYTNGEIFLAVQRLLFVVIELSVSHMPCTYQKGVWKKRCAKKLVHGDTGKGSTCYSNYREDYGPVPADSRQ